MRNIKKSLKQIPNNLLFQAILVFIFCIPLISTLGQFINSKFICENSTVLIIFWPGVKWEFALTMPVWFSFGIIAVSYVMGIGYMCKKKTFGKVVIIGLLGLIMSQLIGKGINYFTGWSELKNINSMNLNGLANKMIFAQWHNPVWEEIVFRGIPLMLILTIKKKLSSKGYKLAVALYFIIPSIAMALYHIPNHGVSKVAATLVLSMVYAWLALKYTFFAPLIMHYIFDSILVISMGKMKGISKNEVFWLSHNSGLLNNSFTIGIIILLLYIVFIFISNMRKIKNLDKMNYSS
ncbi:CPBP family intramembrane glutamic endopeptidase [Clostridium estertheticum]|uniref:CPBP family intramembrane metalloprotease n=1 Tax=Clostridium estertheticum TaxID=238834 RepID=A0A7Y3SZ57_9CLOT|nr:CPBP family intramembrane glutamic endopeptidase [Clostridium estertheticum]NNU78066.1 CPBP family intramembrane metalloprotease [Clostridium estertheticum]WBL49500.1 CPBP family intramembrane metalloprotease [Clostridium estertheticum]